MNWDIPKRVIKMNAMKGKLFAFFIGLICVLILFEVGITIFSSLQAPLVNERTTEDYVILCLGNSYTAGIGAPKGESYPDHLQIMLNSSNFSQNFLVINGGKSNMNSAEMLETIDQMLDEDSPDLVILRVGEPNDWDKYGYHDYLSRTHQFSFLENLKFLINDFFSELKIVKFISILSFNTQNCSFHYSQFDNSSEYTNIVSQSTFHNWSYFVDPEKGDAALEWFQKGINVHPSYPRFYEMSGNIMNARGNISEAINWYLKGIEANPNYFCEGANPSFERLTKIYRSLKDPKLKAKIEKIMRKYPNKIAVIDSEELSEWIKSDLKDIIKIIQQRNIKIIIQNYHPNPLSYHSKSANAILKEFALAYNLPFVDNEAIFQALWDSGENKSDYHWVRWGKIDPHLNSKGYKFMAGNVFQIILDNKSYLNLSSLN